MRKIIGALALLALSSSAMAAIQVRQKPATTVLMGNVDVSTNTATALYVGSDDLDGRSIIKLTNNDPAYDIFIGTHSGVTTSDGYVLTQSTESCTATIELPVGSNYTLYGIGESNGVRGTIDLRLIEIYQK